MLTYHVSVNACCIITCYIRVAMIDLKIYKSDFETMLPANIYLFKVKKRNTRKGCVLCSKLTIKTPERRQ